MTISQKQADSQKDATKPDRKEAEPAETAKSAAKKTGSEKWFLADPTLTPQERHDAMLEWRENEKLMRELEAYLAKPLNFTVKPAEKPKPKKSKDERMEELYRKELDLREEEYQIAAKLRKVTDNQENTEEVGNQLRLLLEGFSYQYHPQGQFEDFHDQFRAMFTDLEERFEETVEDLKKQKNKAIDGQEQAYHKRLRIANDIEADDDDEDFE